MDLPPGLRLVDYDEAYEAELVRLWRKSFEGGVGVTDPHPLADQARYLNETVLPENRVRLVLDASGAVVAFLASNELVVSQLYVHTDHQRKGIGTALLDLAKKESAGKLKLFTFKRNDGARKFYEKHGFRAVRFGMEPDWQLEDVEYVWEG